jgi:hypothetical protein
MMKHLLSVFSVLSCAALASAQQYKLEPVASAAPDMPAGYSQVINPKGYRIVGPSGPWCEIWLRQSLPAGPKPSDGAIALPLAQGTLIGVLRFPATASDRRGQTIKPGLYTLRYSLYPVDGAHQGVAPQRDFVLLTPVANDPDPAATPGFDKLVEMSKTSGTGHAAILGLMAPQGATFPSLAKEGESDWILTVKAGDVPLAIIVAGHAEG